MDVTGEEDDEIGESQESWMTQSNVRQLLVDVVERRSERVEDRAFVSVWRDLGRDKLKIFQHNVHI